MVAIKNIYIPTYCSKCEFQKVKNYKGYCARTGSELMYGDLFNARPSDCPIVEIETADIPYDNVQEKVATQRELICNLNAMNDELQAKLDKIEQIVDKWNNDASHSFEDMCKINSILKE